MLETIKFGKGDDSILREDLSGITTGSYEFIGTSHRAEMVLICRTEGGIGLAANQAGLRMNFFLAMPNARISKSKVPELILNPTWEPATEASPKPSQEGCLSNPGKQFIVPRYTAITAKWINAVGHPQKRVLVGLPAIVFQHECDHLRGKSIWETGTPITK